MGLTEVERPDGGEGGRRLCNDHLNEEEEVVGNRDDNAEDEEK